KETLGSDGRLIQTVDAEEFLRRRRSAPSRAGEVGAVVEERASFVVRALMDERDDRFRIASYSIRKATWDEWWKTVQGSFDERSVVTAAIQDPGSDTASAEPVSALARDDSLLAHLTPAGIPDDTWNSTSPDGVPAPRWRHPS